MNTEILFSGWIISLIELAYIMVQRNKINRLEKKLVLLEKRFNKYLKLIDK